MSSDLLSFRRDVTSEHGEDGIIERIFEIITPGGSGELRWCVDLGALNGVHGSNVWTLIRNNGWKAVLIEADITQFEKLQKEFGDTKGVYCINSYVSFEGEQSLDTIFATTPLQKEFDLFSLDIDGNEYHLWESLCRYRPKVMVVEFNPSIPNDISFIQPRDMSVFQGSSLRSLTELAKEKGYELVAANEVNAFFVVRELFHLFNISDNSLETLHTDKSYQTRLYQLYDGTLCLAGNTRLIWHGKHIDMSKLQVLHGRARHYPARIASRRSVRMLKYYVRKLPLYPWLMRIKRWLTE